jgi:hypothetical protein
LAFRAEDDVMNPAALIQLIEDFEAFKEAAGLLYQRIADFSAAVARTEPMGEAEKVLLDHLKSLLDGAAARLGQVRGSTASGGAASAIHLAFADLRKFAHIRRSKNLPDDFGEDANGDPRSNGHSASNGTAYSTPSPKALNE